MCAYGERENQCRRRRRANPTPASPTPSSANVAGSGTVGTVGTPRSVTRDKSAPSAVASRLTSSAVPASIRTPTEKMPSKSSTGMKNSGKVADKEHTGRQETGELLSNGIWPSRLSNKSIVAVGRAGRHQPCFSSSVPIRPWPSSWQSARAAARLVRSASSLLGAECSVSMQLTEDDLRGLRSQLPDTMDRIDRLIDD